MRESTVFTEPLLGEERGELQKLVESNTLEARLDRIEAGAREILAQAGLPTDLGGVELAPGKIRSVLAMVAEKPHSEEWFAAQILKWASAVRHNVDRGNAEGAAYAALNLGDLVEMAGMKVAWEQDALRGQKVLKSAGKGGRTKAENSQRIREARAEWRKRAAKIRARHPDWSESCVAQQIRRNLLREGATEELDRSFHTIRRYIAKNRKT